jgi:peptide/nickel transport system permease protein
MKRGRTAPTALAFLPVALLFAVSWVSIWCSSGNSGRLVLDRAWARPSPHHIFGCAEGGVDVAVFVAHAAGLVLVLAVGVGICSAFVGTLVGAVATLLGRGVQTAILRICDLVQAFPGFLLAMCVLAAVDRPTRWHLGGVFLLTAWAGFARLTALMARSLVSAEQRDGTCFLGTFCRTCLGRLQSKWEPQLPAWCWANRRWHSWG